MNSISNSRAPFRKNVHPCRKNSGSTQRVAGVLVIAFLLAGCSGSPAAPDGLGELSYENGGARITVPALWAGSDAEGNAVGGVEPAQIFVSTSAQTPEYAVDLADIAAAGAGDAWQAATSMASAFATVFTSADPAAVDINFTVTGPIDGPSAGGILTVGLIAAFQGQSLKQGVTMTGTITADGTIGPVGGVSTKIESAAREGYSTVVLPEAIAPGTWESGNSLTELADSLGVTVVPVRTIGEAYAAMTGNPVEEPDLSPGPPLAAQTETATAAGTQDLIELLGRTLDESQEAIPQDLSQWAGEQLATARDDVAAGNMARAYGNTALALTEIVRARAFTEAEELVSSQGLDAARDELTTRAKKVSDKAQRSLQDASRTPTSGLAQCFALPTAMGWASFSLVTMDGVILELASSSEATVLSEMSQSIAESELGIDVFLPQALDVVTSLETGNGEDCSSVSKHLSGYSRFLVQASDAVGVYLTNVIGTNLDDAGLKEDYTSGALAAQELAQQITPEVDPYPEETEQFTLALTRFWLTSYAVTSKQAYELMPGDTPGEFNAMRNEAMGTSVDQTWWFIKYRAEILASQGLDTGAAVWAARWALEESLSQRGGSYATDADWLALGELWYDAIQVTTMLSYLQPATVQGPPE